jgi:hypothetical protein
MELKIIMLKEISQSQKDKYHMYSLIWSVYILIKGHESRRETNLVKEEHQQWGGRV